MNWHYILLILNLASITLILGAAWLMVFKFPEEETRRWWHKAVVAILVAGFFVRTGALMIVLYALKGHD